MHNFVLPIHSHTFIDASVGNMGFSILPQDASTCGAGQEAGVEPSIVGTTALPPELQPPIREQSQMHIMGDEASKKQRNEDTLIKLSKMLCICSKKITDRKTMKDDWFCCS